VDKWWINGVADKWCRFFYWPAGQSINEPTPFTVGGIGKVAESEASSFVTGRQLVE
jgi:hypothetical protein